MEQIELRVKAYKDLLQGAEILLREQHLFFTERILLKVVRAVYSRRLMEALDIWQELDQAQQERKVTYDIGRDDERL